jgi:flagellin-like hook-associated protein FlgL
MRIGATISGIERQLLNSLAKSNAAAALHTLRLTTGQKFRDPSAGPAAFYQVSNFQNRLSVVNDTLSQVSAASNVAAQLQLTLDKIRTQLDVVRTALVSDEDQTLTAQQRAEKQTQIDAAIEEINQLAATTFNGRRLLDGSADYLASGLDSSQIRNLQVFSTAGKSISGKVLTAATKAELTYTGSGGTISSDAVFTLNGSAGSVAFSVTSGESLADVADLINSVSHKTGITAAAAGDNLALTTVAYGQRATIGIDVSSGSFNVDGSGRGADAIVEINGRVYGGAPSTAASLVHTTANGNLGSATNFTLTGDKGSFNFSFASGSSLQSVADAINQQVSQTGVKATIALNGKDLVLSTDSAGSSSQVSLRVTSGTFAVSAAGGSTVTSQTAAEKALLQHIDNNGKLANNASIRLSGQLGSTVLVLKKNDTLAEVATSVNAQTGSTGVTAQVLGNTLEFTSTGANASAFVRVEVLSGSFPVSGGDGNGYDTGVDAATAVRGKDGITGRDSVDGNRVNVNNNGLHFLIEFAAGFTGNFNTVNVSDQQVMRFALSPQPGDIAKLGLPGVQATRLGGLSGRLDQLRSDGALAGLDDKTSQALRVVDESLAQLAFIDRRVDNFADVTIASSSALLSGFRTTLETSIESINGVNFEEEASLLAKNQALADNALAALSILHEQRLSVVQLIKQIAGLR